MPNNFLSMVKNAVRSSGPNLTKKRIALVSKIAFYLMNVSLLTEDLFGKKKSSQHTTRSMDSDVNTIVNVLLKNEFTVEKVNRQLEGGGFSDPRRDGLQKIADGWLKKFLLKDSQLTDEAWKPTRQVEDMTDLIY